MSSESRRRRRVPAFTPVPVRSRRDGWTPMRQAAFLGALAKTGSVSDAARIVGMSRESAYRLRERAGAESFAASWDAIVAQPPARKSTSDQLLHRLASGILKPMMRDGKHVATRLTPDNDALSRLYRRHLQTQRAARPPRRS
jgi:molybdenum-dependent DNA-binding transcriptional regulator ModE